MKRRDFLKILGASPFVPSVLMAKEAVPFKPNKAQELIMANGTHKTVPLHEVSNPNDWETVHFVGIALEDIPKRAKGWIQIC